MAHVPAWAWCVLAPFASLRSRNGCMDERLRSSTKWWMTRIRRMTLLRHLCHEPSDWQARRRLRPPSAGTPPPRRPLARPGLRATRPLHHEPTLGGGRHNVLTALSPNGSRDDLSGPGPPARSGASDEPPREIRLRKSRCPHPACAGRRHRIALGFGRKRNGVRQCRCAATVRRDGQRVHVIQAGAEGRTEIRGPQGAALTQLLGIFEKTRTSRQAQLIKLLLSGRIAE